jgi:hypothetical protein
MKSAQACHDFPMALFGAHVQVSLSNVVTPVYIPLLLLPRMGPNTKEFGRF